ncbi:acyclic terpene utilization AtuA family protein [Pseudonocardia sulfidoxydans]|uniref:acyclic terpene utilization AtuA family protein n=1 Tax=Pseudonocardia sulfidoxydans TaxID=54011 RepID=UPI0036D268F6
MKIGCGSAYASDWLEPAKALADSGLVDYLAFDCLAERTLALAQIRKLADPSTGQDLRLARIMEDFAGFLGSNRTIVGNFGAANPDAAAADVVAGARKAGLDGLRVGVIRGDDVLKQVLDLDVALPERGVTAGQVRDRIVSAHAYIGAEPVVELLGEGARFVLGGRIADPSLFVGPICHELGWDLDDWASVGVATVAGHLLECGIHVTGANFADPPLRVLPALHDLAAPFAQVTSDRRVIVGKLDGTGGGVTEATVKTQLGYEVNDPAAYLTPDVTADFSALQVREIGPDRVEVTGAGGQAAPERLKVLVGLDLGFDVVGEVSYGGPGCVERARLAADVMRERFAPFAEGIDELRVDLLGVDALFEGRLQRGYPAEVRLRLAVRCADCDTATAVAEHVEFLYFAVAGGGGVTKSMRPAIGVTPAYLDRDTVRLETEVVTA